MNDKTLRHVLNLRKEIAPIWVKADPTWHVGDPIQTENCPYTADELRDDGWVGMYHPEQPELTVPKEHMKIKVVVSCSNANGEPDFFPCAVVVSQEEYDNGEHYDQAIEIAVGENYEAPFFAYDENDEGFKWFKEKYLTD